MRNRYSKYNEDTMIQVSFNYEVLLENGNTGIISSNQSMKLSVLSAMGHILQRDFYNELEELVEELFQDSDQAIAVLDQYITCIFDNSKATLDSKALYLDGTEFIPELRGLHGITNSPMYY